MLSGKTKDAMPKHNPAINESWRQGNDATGLRDAFQASISSSTESIGSDGGGKGRVSRVGIVASDADGWGMDR
jgi:hypothetical protein